MAAHGPQRVNAQDVPRRREFPTGWSEAQDEHLSTWLPAIFIALRPGHSVEDEGDSLRSGSLVWYGDHWHHFSNGAHGHSAFSMVAELMQGRAKPPLAYAQEFLVAHPGTGTWAGIDTEAWRAQAERNAEKARHWLQVRVSVANIHAATYFADERRILLREGLDSVVGYVADVEPSSGYGAILGVLVDSAHLETVIGCQLGYLAVAKHVRTVEGKRRRRMLFTTLDRAQRRRACFYIPPLPFPQDGGEAPSVVAATVICEGLENALAVAAAYPHATVLGIPGIHRLSDLTVTGPVVVLRDNDGEAASATIGLRKGVDALLVARRVGSHLTWDTDIWVTDTPPGRDAADYVADGQLDELRQLISDAKPAKVSDEGEFRWLATLDPVSYDRERAPAKKRLGLGRVEILDDAVNQYRWSEDDGTVSDGFEDVRTRDNMWAAPINNIAAVCDAVHAQLKRYLIADDGELAAAVIWALHAHFIHHEQITLDISPRLLFEAKDADSGKTTAMEAISCLTPRYLRVMRMSRASFSDLVDSHRVTLFVDELDKLLRRQQHSDLIEVLLAGHRRHEAYAPIRIPRPDGRGWDTALQKLWLTFAGTAISGHLTDTQMRSRFIVMTLVCATQAESKGLLHLRHGFCPVLDQARQQFARWAADQQTLPDIPRPDELFNREGDNWEPLLWIAAMVGGRWPATIQAVALKAAGKKVRDDNDLAGAFLLDLHRILLPSPGADPLPHIWTRDLTTRLRNLDDPSADWTRAYHGSEITDYWTGRMLGRWLDPDSPQPITVGRQKLRGVYTSQLQDVFTRHLKKPTYARGGDTEREPPVSSMDGRKDAVNNSENSRTQSNTPAVPFGEYPFHTASLPGSAAHDAIPRAKGNGSSSPGTDGTAGRFGVVPQRLVEIAGEFGARADGTDGTGAIPSAGASVPLNSAETRTDAQLKVAQSDRRRRVNGQTAPVADPEREARLQLPDEEIDL
jgi:hypothetical protein